MTIITNWVDPPSDRPGQDHLALRAISEAMYSELVPCVTNQTARIRLYAFYPWFAWTFTRRRPDGSYDEFVELFRRAECLLTMIGARHETGEEKASRHGEGLAGRRALLEPTRHIDKEPCRLSTYAAEEPARSERYFRGELGGLGQYYLGTLQTLDVMSASRKGGVKVSPGRGVRLAQVFDENVPGDAFWDAVLKDEVDADVLDACADFCPCGLEHAELEQSALLDVLLNRDGVEGAFDMRDAYRLLCDYVAAIAAGIDDSAGLVQGFRESVYSRTLAGASWDDSALTKWAGYQRHELFSVAIQSLFSGVYRYLERVDEQGQLPLLQSGRDVANFVLSHVSFQGLELNQSFDAFFDSVAAQLPALAAVEDPEHELNKVRTLLDEEKTGEDVSAIVVMAVRLLAVVLARMDDTPPYGGFVREESYFRDYPVNLRTLRVLGRDRWRTTTVKEWLHWLIQHWVVSHQARVAMAKLHAQGLDTFRLRPSDFGLRPVGNVTVGYSSPRLVQALRALRDLGLVDEQHQLTKRGLELQEALHV